MQLLCVCTAFRLVLEELEVPMTEELRTVLEHMQFLEHVPRPQPLDHLIDELREELAQLLFEREPDAIYRRWLTARVKNVGHNVQTSEERDFAAVKKFDTMVVHYGFHELFYAPCAEELPAGLEVLERVGATETRDLVQEAMDLLGNPFPTDLKERRKIWQKKSSRGVKKNRWERDLDGLYAEYFDLEERCVDVAAKRAVEAYLKRGMPVPPVIPRRGDKVTG